MPPSDHVDTGRRSTEPSDHAHDLAEHDTTLFLHHDTATGKYHLSSSVQDDIRERLKTLPQGSVVTEHKTRQLVEAFRKMPSPEEIFEKTGAPPMDLKLLQDHMSRLAARHDHPTEPWQAFLPELRAQWLTSFGKMKSSLRKLRGQFSSSGQDEEHLIWAESKSNEMIEAMLDWSIPVMELGGMYDDKFIGHLSDLDISDGDSTRGLLPWKQVRLRVKQDPGVLSQHFLQATCTVAATRKRLQNMKTFLGHFDFQRQNLNMSTGLPREVIRAYRAEESLNRANAEENFQIESRSLRKCEGWLKTFAHEVGVSEDSFQTNVLLWAEFANDWISQSDREGADFTNAVCAILANGWGEADRLSGSTDPSPLSGERALSSFVEHASPVKPPAEATSTSQRHGHHHAGAGGIQPLTSGVELLSIKDDASHNMPAPAPDTAHLEVPRARQYHLQVEASWTELCSQAKLEREALQKLIKRSLSRTAKAMPWWSSELLIRETRPTAQQKKTKNQKSLRKERVQQKKRDKEKRKEQRESRAVLWKHLAKPREKSENAYRLPWLHELDDGQLEWCLPVDDSAWTGPSYESRGRLRKCTFRDWPARSTKEDEDEEGKAQRATGLGGRLRSLSCPTDLSWVENRI